MQIADWLTIISSAMMLASMVIVVLRRIARKTKNKIDDAVVDELHQTIKEIKQLKDE